MKKIISVLMIAVMLVSVFVVPTTATEFDASKFKYFEKTVEYYGEMYREAIMYCYDELYYHYSDENSEDPDWALIYCCIQPQPIEMKYGTAVGDRVISVVGGDSVGFMEGHGVYIKETDSIIVLGQRNMDRIIQLCPDFIESIEENEIGQAFGDVDNDNKLTVIDATYIQMCLAGYILPYDYVGIDGGRSHVLISDFDRDGERTVLDATAIQMKLAKLS